jgi:sugar phosphate isomerase/epimerase
VKISFMTLGCPGWDLDTICRCGREYGFQGVDLRGYLDTLDITLNPLFTVHAKDTYRRLVEAGLEVSAISSSITICDVRTHQKNLEEARRTITVARSFNCHNVRIFGGGDISQYSIQELAKIGCDGMDEILGLDGANELHWLFETHDNWIKAQDCQLLMNQISNPSFGVVWDMGHTSRVGGETPDQSYAELGKRIGYTHIKDAVYDPNHPLTMQDGWRYMLPGMGQLPLNIAINLLLKNNYGGWFTFENEKRWHPELPEPEVAFPAFVKWIRQFGQ